jgi:hypothetical protein
MFRTSLLCYLWSELTSLIQYYYYLAINCTVVSLCDIQPQWCKCINVTRSAKRGLIGCRNSKFRFTCLSINCFAVQSSTTNQNVSFLNLNCVAVQSSTTNQNVSFFKFAMTKYIKSHAQLKE